MKRNLFLLCFLSLVSLSFAQVNRVSDGFEATVKGVDIKVQFYSPDIVRVFKTTATSNLERKRSFVVTMTPQPVDLAIDEQSDKVVAKSSDLEVSLNLITGSIQFKDLSGKSLLAEKDYGVQLMPVEFVQHTVVVLPVSRLVIFGHN